MRLTPVIVWRPVVDTRGRWSTGVNQVAGADRDRADRAVEALVAVWSQAINGHYEPPGAAGG
jgi:hypothetical protein